MGPYKALFLHTYFTCGECRVTLSSKIHMPPKQKKMKKSAIYLRRTKNKNLKNLIWPIVSIASI